MNHCVNLIVGLAVCDFIKILTFFIFAVILVVFEAKFGGRN